MGYKSDTLSKKKYKQQGKSNKNNLQCYYTQLYDQFHKTLSQQGHQRQYIDRCLLSIFSRTKIPTKTNDNRLLQLLDIDKIISINQRSLKENSEEIKQMRMVASIKQQRQQLEQNEVNGNSRPIGDLVRLARLHMLRHMNQNQGDNDQSEDEEQNRINPRLQRLREIRIQRLRNQRTQPRTQ